MCITYTYFYTVKYYPRVVPRILENSPPLQERQRTNRKQLAQLEDVDCVPAHSLRLSKLTRDQQPKTIKRKSYENY